jgi:hypothetical protein
MTSTPRSERGEQSTSFEDSGVVRARRDHVLRRGSLTNGRIPAIVATLATDGWDGIGFNE